MRIICWIKAIPDWLAFGVWCPHVYREESKTNQIIIARKNGFRIAKNYMHNENETVYPNATLVTNKCICCGKKELSWYVGKIPII